VVRKQLEEKGFETFLPTVTRLSRWKDRKKAVDWPLFPGYCFARFDPSDRVRVLTCAGAVSVVGFSGDITPIPDEEIDSIRRLIASHLPYDPAPLLREGMMVEVTAGPLEGLTGRLVRKGSQDRLILAVNLIGQGASVDIDAADVRAL
jgi:transcription antitermination factor NusG